MSDSQEDLLGQRCPSLSPPPPRVVRHRQAAEGPYGVTDKFRIDISIDRKVVGRKQVTASLVRRKSPAEAVDVSASLHAHSFTDTTFHRPLPPRLSPSCLQASSETGEQTARRPATLPYVQLPSPPQRHGNRCGSSGCGLGGKAVGVWLGPPLQWCLFSESHQWCPSMMPSSVGWALEWWRAVHLLLLIVRACLRPFG